MLILLTHANHIYSDSKQVRKMQPYPPLQTLIAAALLRRDGHEVVFFDCTFDRNFISSLDSRRPDLVAVCEDNFNFLTKMCLLQNRELAFAIAAAARQRGIPAIVNSSDSTNNPQPYLAAGFDLVILGELERTLSEVCRDPEQSHVPGTAWWNAEAARIECGATRAPIADLDELPMPAWDLVDIHAYRHAWTHAHGHFSLNLTASRGCPYHCNWCAKPVHGDAYRQQTPDRVAAEMECVHELFAPDQLWFADDIFGLSGRWTREFAACVERRGSRIPFRMQSRCDLMTRETVEALRRAGCIEIWMGAESGSQRILDAMEKGIRAEQIAEARENLRRHGIRACLFIQFGYLGEEWDDIERTIRMVRDVRPDDIGVSVSYPMPNTRFHQIVQAQLGAQTNWRDSADLAMMYQGSFPTEFYRALADALHMEVRGGDVNEAWEKVEQLRCACC
ncbi:MAG: Radical domain protein [Bryobacterales bacterium]|nr:Radical domain protein [Bryobacterales bacterium]